MGTEKPIFAEEKPMEEDFKNPEEYADKEVGRKLGKAIAERKYRIKELQAEIKKLEKEIEKIKAGELVPSSSAYSPEIIAPRPYRQPQSKGIYTTIGTTGPLISRR